MMEQTPQEIIHSHLYLLLFFSLLGIIIQALAYYRGFYTLPSLKKEDGPKTTLISVIAVFLIYLATMTALPILATLFLQSIHKIAPWEHSATIKVSGIIHFVAAVLALYFLFLYQKHQNRPTILKMWKDKTLSKQPIGIDILFGALTYVIAFPLVAAVSQLFDLLLYLLFQVQHYEQSVVTYLRSALGIPLVFVILLFIVLIAAPIIEELLFRGFLQNFIKRKLGPQKAILISSICFALFHFAPSQGLGNISLLSSLFVFALFLGFIYERQRSLFASISLHAIFNLISALRIFFLYENP